MKRILLFLFLFVTTGIMQAQQFPLTDHYVVNPYALNQSMAGYYGSSELHMDYRREWNKFSSGPQTFSLNGFGNLYHDKLWLGGSTYLDNSGLISVFKLNMSVSYILQTGENQQLFFGVWGSYYQSSIDLMNLVDVDPNDPLLQNRDKLNGSTFNVGFGVDYNFNNLNVGMAMPNAVRDPYLLKTSDQVHFNFQQEFLFHLSNLFYINDQWQMQGMGVVRKTANEPGNLDLSATAIYQDRFWMGTLYRSTGTLSLYVGGCLNGGWVLGYYYDMGLGGVNKYGGGSHEISLSFRFGMLDNRFFQRKVRSDYSGRRYRNTPRVRPRIID